MKYYYRCASCRARRVFSKSVDLYVRPPHCNGCGGRRWWVDGHRIMQQKTKTGSYEVCQCDGAHYLHRPGSVALCDRG